MATTSTIITEKFKPIISKLFNNDILIKSNAIIAGGCITSIFHDEIINDIDMYVNIKNSINLIEYILKIGYSFSLSNSYSMPAYDESFFRKNNILARFQFKYDDQNSKPIIDVMLVKNEIMLPSVVDNFDLSFCKIYYDGIDVKTKYETDVISKNGTLSTDYFKSVENMNQFTLLRILKYMKKNYYILNIGQYEEIMNEFMEITGNMNIHESYISMTGKDDYMRITHDLISDDEYISMSFYNRFIRYLIKLNDKCDNDNYDKFLNCNNLILLNKIKAILLSIFNVEISTANLFLYIIIYLQVDIMSLENLSHIFLSKFDIDIYSSEFFYNVIINSYYISYIPKKYNYNYNNTIKLLKLLHKLFDKNIEDNYYIIDDDVYVYKYVSLLQINDYNPIILKLINLEKLQINAPINYLILDDIFKHLINLVELYIGIDITVLPESILGLHKLNNIFIFANETETEIICNEKMFDFLDNIKHNFKIKKINKKSKTEIIELIRQHGIKTINVNENNLMDKCRDIILYTSNKIQKLLSLNPNSFILINYENQNTENIFCYDYFTIKSFINDTNNIYYECLGNIYPNGDRGIGDINLYLNKPYYIKIPLNFNIFIEFNELELLLEMAKYISFFYIIPKLNENGDRIVISNSVSKLVLDGGGRTFIGTNHCQNGSVINIYTFAVCTNVENCVKTLISDIFVEKQFVDIDYDISESEEED